MASLASAGAGRPPRRLLDAELAGIAVALTTGEVAALHSLPQGHAVEALASGVAVGLLVVGIRAPRLPLWWWSVAQGTALAFAATAPVGSVAATLATVVLVTLLLQLAATVARDPRPSVRGGVVTGVGVLALVATTALGGGSGTGLGAALVVTSTAVTTAAAHRRPRPPVLSSPPPSAVARARTRWGTTHIAAFATGPDKSSVALPGGGIVSFRLCYGVAVTTGDPLAAATAQPAAIAAFVALARQHGWVPCFYQTDPRLRDAYRAAGLRCAKFGEEAVVEVTTFTLDTPRRANLRREVGRAHRAGLTATVLPWAAATPALFGELRAVSAAWLQGRGQEMGFSLGRLDETVDPDAWLTVVRDGDGVIHAFSSWLPLGADGIALDLLRRRPKARAGAVDLCLAETLAEARRAGIRCASLGAVPFRDSLGDSPDGRLGALLRRWLFGTHLCGYRYPSLAAFKEKFAPVWLSRDVAYDPRAALRSLVGLLGVHFAPPPGSPGPGATPASAGCPEGRAAGGRSLWFPPAHGRGTAAS